MNSEGVVDRPAGLVVVIVDESLIRDVRVSRELFRVTSHRRVEREREPLRLDHRRGANNGLRLGRFPERLDVDDAGGVPVGGGAALDGEREFGRLEREPALCEQGPVVKLEGRVAERVLIEVVLADEAGRPGL